MGSVLTTQTKKFAIYTCGNDYYNCVYTNVPIDKQQSKNCRVVEWKEGYGRPYLAEMYYFPVYNTAQQVISRFESDGFKLVELYTLETNTFSMRVGQESNDDRTIFGCTSTANFTGVPNDTPGFEGDMCVRQSYPGQWSFSVPTVHVEDVKQTLLQRGWIEKV